ncbi:hypothetical protein VTO42DRAFT_8592 [Malbranchea cinnamomea]
MGWFSWGSSSGPAKASDGGLIAPDRSSRQQCYLARDFFFDCLDENGIIDAIKDEKAARSKCGKLMAEFEGACSATWGKYFKEKRVMEWKRQQTIDKIKADDAEREAQRKAKLSEQKEKGLFS